MQEQRKQQLMSRVVNQMNNQPTPTGGRDQLRQSLIAQQQAGGVGGPRSAGALSEFMMEPGSSDKPSDDKEGSGGPTSQREARRTRFAKNTVSDDKKSFVCQLVV
jgi:hypothetical protein